MPQPNRKVLYIIYESPISKKGNQLAIHVHIQEEESILVFHNTGRGHMFESSIKETFDNGFIFEVKRDYPTAMNGLWKSREITIEEFEHKIYKCVGNREGIAKHIHSTEDVWQYFRQLFPMYT